MRRSAYFSPAFGLALGLACCRPEEAAPDLLELTQITPRVLEVGDHVTLAGSGFPEGRPARVTFRGDLFRPGQTPLRNVTITARADASDPHSIRLSVTSDLARDFCGSEGDAHATFRGAVVAVFGARSSGAPEVRGSVEGVVLDVSPASVSPAVSAARAREAARFATFLGMTVQYSSERGLLGVMALDPHGRAARAGLMPSDELLELDGLRLRSALDLVPQPRVPLARLLVRRADQAQPESFGVDISGFQSGSPRELVPAATFLGLVVTLLALLVSPLSRANAWLAQRLTQRLHERAEHQPSLSVRKTRRERLFAALAQELPLSPLPYLVFIADTWLLTWIALGRTLVARELDLPVLYLSSLTLLIAAAFILGARHGRARFSLMSGLRRAGLTLIFQLPVLAGTACVLISTGSLRPDDVLAAQGPFPWQWFFVSSPPALCALLLLVLGLVPVIRGTGSSMAEALGETRAPALPRVTLPEWSHLILTSGIIALLFLGGTRTPDQLGLPAGGFLEHAVLACVFAAKSLCVFSGVLLLRFSVGQLDVAQTEGLGWRYLLPLSLAAGFGCYLWNSGFQNPTFTALRLPITYALCLFCAGSALEVAIRLLSSLDPRSMRASVSPWI